MERVSGCSRTTYESCYQTTNETLRKTFGERTIPTVVPRTKLNSYIINPNVRNNRRHEPNCIQYIPRFSIMLQE